MAWKEPRYKPAQRLPKVPTTEAINKIIARPSRKYATNFKVLAEMRAMPVELHRTARGDIDLERGAINLPGCKGHSPRRMKLKPGTVAMLRTYLAKY